MIRQATADDIKKIVRALREQAQSRDWEFDDDTALESVRRQAVLANSTVLVTEDSGDITGVLFAVLTNTGFNTLIQAQITNIWSRDDDADRAQYLVDHFCANVDGVDEIFITQWIADEYDLRDIEPVLTTYRIR